MSNYNVRYTDIDKPPIQVQEGTQKDTPLDIALFGRSFLEYGEQLNETLLHLLEHFACVEDAGTPHTPDLDRAIGDVLAEPTKGQLWYNSTRKSMYVWDGVRWTPLSNATEVSANWGTICTGEQIPRPVTTTGHVFPYSECTWIVSPAEINSELDYVGCGTDGNATVNFTYRTSDGSFLNGYVNYMIIGIRFNSNDGTHNFAPTAQ